MAPVASLTASASLPGPRSSFLLASCQSSAHSLPSSLLLLFQSTASQGFPPWNLPSSGAAAGACHLLQLLVAVLQASVQIPLRLCCHCLLSLSSSAPPLCPLPKRGQPWVYLSPGSPPWPAFLLCTFPCKGPAPVTSNTPPAATPWPNRAQAGLNKLEVYTPSQGQISSCTRAPLHRSGRVKEGKEAQM